MRLTINPIVLSHTASHPGYTVYAGNFGLWQGYLSADTHCNTVPIVSLKVSHTFDS